MGRNLKYVLLVVAVILATSFGLLASLSTLQSDKIAATNTAVAAGIRVARTGACSAALKDGSVLITGGQGANGVLAGAETFNAKRGSSDAAPMRHARVNHACAALPDGRVLVAGGKTLGGGTINNAEIFDPATGVWTEGGAMSTPRSGVTAVPTSKGRVLIAGGESNGVPTATLEIFDPATNSFTPVASHLSSPRMEHASAALADGRVLIAGGTDGRNALDTIDIFDPASGLVTAFDKKLSTPRTGLSATVLLDGRVYFAGGSDGKQELATAEIYNPKTGAFTPAAPMSVPRAGHLAIRVPNNNSILIVGGNNKGGQILAQEIYIPWWDKYKSFGTVGQQQAHAAMTLKAVRPMDTTPAVTTGTDGSVLPTLITDQPDYAPGETVQISGSGWPMNATVNLLLQRDPVTLPDDTFTGTTDADGNLSATYLVVQGDLGVTFTLSAWVGEYATAQIQTVNFKDDPTVHFVTSGFVTDVSACSPAVVIQTPGKSSTQVTLHSTSSTGTFYSDSACATQITSIYTSATTPPRATFYYKDSTVGTPTIWLTAPPNFKDGDPAHPERGGAQQETISSSAIHTTIAMSVDPASVAYSVSSTVTLTATLTRSDTGGVLAGATIDFIVNGTDLGAATTNASGQATNTFDPSAFPPPPGYPLPISSYLVIAEYSGGKIGANTYTGSSDTETFTITGTAPMITSGNSYAFTVGASGNFTVVATGAPTPALGASGTLPTGVSFVDNGNGTATLSGTPAASTGGTYALTLTAANGVSPNATQNFTLTVNQPPAITSADHITFTVGQAGSFTVTTTGFPPPGLTSGGALPNGVTFADNGNGTATLGGTPAAGTGGTYALTLTAANGVSPNATQNFTLTVNQPPAITSVDHITLTVGQAGSFTVTTTGFPPPALTETGALPPGVTFADNGNGTATLSGIPAAGTGGSYALTFTATNGVSPNATQSFVLTVNQPPAITSANHITFTVGQAGSFMVTTTGFPVPGLASGGALPGGVTFADNGNGTATLGGIPAAGTGGSYALTFTATNGVSPNATQSFVLTVNQPPAVTSANHITFTVGQAGSFTVTTTGFPAPALTETGALPVGVTFVDNANGTATLSGIPAAGTASFYPIVFTAANSVLPNAVQNFMLTVQQPTSTTVSAASGQYSDLLILNAIVAPAGSPGAVTFSVNGGPPVAATYDPITGNASLSYTITLGEGLYNIQAVYNPTSPYLPSSGTNTLTITKEDASLNYDPTNAVAVPVTSPGSGISTPFTLTAYVKESWNGTREPSPADVTLQAPGDITLITPAAISMALNPVGPGSPVTPTSCALTDNGSSGYQGKLTFSCAFNGVPLNTYSIATTLNSSYYRGAAEDVVAVYDPSLGFTTGGGHFIWPGTADPNSAYVGDLTNFGFNMQYSKNGSNPKGSVLVIRHRQDGTIVRLKSNSMTALSLGQNAAEPMGWATITGKSTYFDSKSMPQPAGNQDFMLYVEDRNEPGTGNDRIWIQVIGWLELSLPPTAQSNVQTLTGGNIVVPHTNTKK